MSEFAPRLTLTTDVSQASWLAHTALETGVAGSFVPTGLEAYVQVLHPAETSEGDPVRWRVVADWLQAPLLAGVWFHDFEELAAGRPERDRPWTAAPREGEIPDEVLERLTPVLTRHTTFGPGVVLPLGRLGIPHRLDVARRRVACGSPAAARHPLALSLPTGIPAGGAQELEGASTDPGLLPVRGTARSGRRARRIRDLGAGRGTKL